MNKKYKAFTLFELILVLTIIGFIAALTLSTAFKPEYINKKKLIPLSHKFYTEAETVYMDTTFNKSNNGLITGLKDANGDSAITSDDLLIYFVKRMDGEFFDPPTAEEKKEDPKITTNNCKMLVASGAISGYPELARCAMFPTHLVAGFYLNPSCNTSVQTSNYLTQEVFNGQDPIIKTQSNSCGFIIYQLDNARDGMLGQDTFVIALGKKSFKQK